MNTERLKELKFTSWCINNATSIYVFTFIIVVWGFMTYMSLPKELFPDVVVPTISVVTIYPGATPEDIENLKIIFHLVDDKGFTLKGAKEHLKTNTGEIKENQKIIASLEKLKDFLLKLNEEI